VFETFKKEILFVNKDKCIFKMNHVVFLKFVVSFKGVEMNGMKM